MYSRKEITFTGNKLRPILNILKRIALVLVCSFTLAITPFAQEPSKEMIDEMVHIIASHIEENYVLANKGLTIAEYFRNDHSNGRFYGHSTMKKLDSTLTKSLLEVSQDHHLFTWNNLSIVEELKSTSVENEDSDATNFFNNEAAYTSNFGFQKIEILPGNIGYLALSKINISDLSLPKLTGAMAFVSDTDALIIDLRNNGGGGSTIGPVLESFFFTEHTELLEFTSRNGKTDISATVGWLLEERYTEPLYVLINNGTASAAEAFAFALKHQNRATLIGEPSAGAAYMNTYFPVNDQFIVAISTSAPFLPGTTESWEGKGVQPHYVVDPDQALEKAVELIQSK